MPTRATWKGVLTLDDISCPVSLHAAGSTADRITLHQINRKTGNRARRQYVDEDTGKPVDKDNLAKAMEMPNGEFLIFDESELQQATPDATKVLEVSSFIACNHVDQARFDRPYFLYPDEDEEARETYAMLRDQMSKSGTAALASAILFRRDRRVLIRPHGDVLIAHTLHYDHQMRDETALFRTIPELKMDKEMLDLAGHIIDTRTGTFDPSTFEDRYENALMGMIRAKLAGKPLPKAKKPPRPKKQDLREALRESVRKAS